MREQWKTRTHGSRLQKGKHFLFLGQKSHMPAKHWKAPRSNLQRSTQSQRSAQSPIPLADLERHADAHETKLLMKESEELRKKGYKPWTISVAYLDGTEEDIDIIARSWVSALNQARSQMKHIDYKAVDKIIIEDPDFGAFFKKVGATARKTVSMAKRGVTKGISIARKAKAEGMKGAHLLGRIAATPGEITESYRAGAEGRPVEAEPIPVYAKPSAGELTSRMRANIAKDRLAQARAEEELAKIAERRRLLR